MPRKYLALFIIGLLLVVGYFVFGASKQKDQNPDFKDLSPQEMHQRIIKERDFAIGQAIAKGDYKCCINPPCTMCFMEANQWNNHTPGTCACDDLIAQGKEPCPQCKKAFCGGENASCNFKPTNTQQ